MPKINHRLVSAKTGDKIMQISRIFSKIKMPILNGGLLFVILSLYNFMAYGAYTTCPNCYRCTSYDGFGNCLSCVYDRSYCNGDVYCPDNQHWDASQQKCVCNSNKTCLLGQYFDEVTCECETKSCPDGQYPNGENCLNCPTVLPMFIVSGTDCGPHTNTTGGFMGYITRCYYSSSCKYRDTTGEYEWEQDCHYDNSAIIG